MSYRKIVATIGPATMSVDAIRRLGLAVPKEGERSMDPNLRMQLASSGITGVRFLQTDFFDPGRYPPPANPGVP